MDNKTNQKKKKKKKSKMARENGKRNDTHGNMKDFGMVCFVVVMVESLLSNSNSGFD